MLNRDVLYFSWNTLTIDYIHYILDEPELEKGPRAVRCTPHKNLHTYVNLVVSVK